MNLHAIFICNKGESLRRYVAHAVAVRVWRRQPADASGRAAGFERGQLLVCVTCAPCYWVTYWALLLQCGF